MTLEFEADSKAAERKAMQSGMEVHRTEALRAGALPDTDPAGDDRPDATLGLVLRFVILIALAAAGFWWFYLRPHNYRWPGM